MNYLEGLKRVLKETTTVGNGTFGTAEIGNQGGNVGNVDFYAVGDARVPFVLGTNDKKKKKKKKKKPMHVYRRNFVEESVSTDDFIIDGVLFCGTNEGAALATKIVKRFDIHYFCENNVVYMRTDDDTIREVIDMLYETIGEDNFCSEYYCLLGEFDYSIILKRPKKRREDYNIGQLSRGAQIEMEHTPNRQVAEIIAMQHLDEDELYYDKLRKIHNEQPVQRQRNRKDEQRKQFNI